MTFADIVSTVASYIPYVIAASSAAASALPPPSSASSPWNTVRSIIDVLAMNFGNAENKAPKDPHIR